MAKGVRKTCREFEVVSGMQYRFIDTPYQVPAVVDVGACLSRINHRLFRQGRQYKVRVQADINSFGSNDPRIEVYALAPTWWVNAAWRKAKAAYDGAMSDEKKVLAKENLAKWRDFRVGSGLEFVGGDMIADGGAEPILEQITNVSDVIPPTFTRTAFSQGEFNLASVKNLDSGELMTFTWGEGGANAFDILGEYARTRNESASPETVITQMPYDSLLAEGEDLDYQELQANGNEPPYDALSFPTAYWVPVALLSPDNPQALTTGYFHAPCGIVVIRNLENDGGAPADLGRVRVEVAEGDYHGVHAPAM